jgi:tripeptidyl-peptidase-1
VGGGRLRATGALPRIRTKVRHGTSCGLFCCSSTPFRECKLLPDRHWHARVGPGAALQLIQVWKALSISSAARQDSDEHIKSPVHLKLSDKSKTHPAPLTSKMLLLTLFPGLLAICAASPLASPSVLHESRSSIPHGWVKREELDRRAILPMRIALTQSNLHKGEEWLMQVSHPDSEKYGKHWTVDDVASAFAPS